MHSKAWARIQRYCRGTKLAGLGGLQTMKAVHTVQELRPLNSRFSPWMYLFDAIRPCCGARQRKSDRELSLWPEVALKDTNSVLHT